MRFMTLCVMTRVRDANPQSSSRLVVSSRRLHDSVSRFNRLGSTASRACRGSRGPADQAQAHTGSSVTVGSRRNLRGLIVTQYSSPSP